MTSQLAGVLLVILSSVMAYVVSLRLDRRRPGRGELHGKVRAQAGGKPRLSRRRRFPPLHY